MSVRKWLLTTVISGTLVLSSGVAQAGMNLQPDSDWAVSKLEAAQTGGQPYCALARRFTNNLVLTIARNAHDESSVAVDFQKQTLSNTQNYRVTLKPGFGQDRAFDVRPVSGKALVIRVGQDYAFHDALGRSGTLDVDISGETYNFNLQDYSAGQKKLSECLVNLVEPAAGSSEPVMPLPEKQTQSGYMTVSGSSASVAVPQQPPAADYAASGEATSLREENARLRSALEKERRMYEDRFMQEGQSSSLVAELNEKLGLLQTENDALRQQVASNRPVPQAVPSCPESAAPDASLQGDLSLLRDENLRLTQDLAEQQARNSLLETQLAEKRAPEATDSASAAVAEELRVRVAALEEDNRKLKTENETLSKGGADVPVSLAQLRSVEEQLRYVQADRDKLLAQIEGKDQDKRESLLDISSDNWNLEQATRRFNEAERENGRLARELEEQRTQCATDKKKLEYMLFDPEVAKQEQITKLMDLETKVDQAQGVWDKEKTGYEQTIASLQKDMEDRSSDSSAAQARIAELEVQLQQNVEKISAGSAEAQARVVELERQLQQNAEKINAGSAEAQERVAALERELQQVRASEIAKDTAALDAIRQERDMLAQRKTVVEQDNSRLNDTIASLQSRLDAMGRQQSSASDAELVALREENSALARQRDMLERDRVALENQKTDLSEKIALLESSLDDIQTSAGAAAPPPPVVAEPVAVAVNAIGGNGTVPSSDYRTFGNSVSQSVTPSAASAHSLITASAIRGVLDRAHVPVQGDIQQVGNAGRNDFVAYSWDTGALFGSAEQQPMGSQGRFDDLAQAYLDKTKSRCQGDFAAVPALAKQAGTLRVSAYEIACINGQDGASASVVFYDDGGLFTTIAHESGLDGMNAAMDARDRVVEMLLQTQVALK